MTPKMSMSGRTKMTEFILNSLDILGYFGEMENLSSRHEGFTLLECQQLILWLEEWKIRLLPIAHRAGLRLTDPSNLSKWLTHLRQYLRALNITVSKRFDWCDPNHRIELISHLIILALQDEYLDAKEAKVITRDTEEETKILSQQKVSIEGHLPLSESDAIQLTQILRESGFLKETETLLSLPNECLQTLLQSIEDYIKLDTSSIQSKNWALQANALPRGGIFESQTLDIICKVLRSLHIEKIQRLEKLGNLAIAQIQTLVAEPEIYRGT